MPQWPVGVCCPASVSLCNPAHLHSKTKHGCRSDRSQLEDTCYTDELFKDQGSLVS